MLTVTRRGARVTRLDSPSRARTADLDALLSRGGDGTARAGDGRSGRPAYAGGRADAAVARAAAAAAATAGLPAVASTRPGPRGTWALDLGADAETARAIQRSTATAHASQAEALPAVVRRLDLLGSGETLRWLLFPQQIPAQHEDQVS